MGLSVTIITAFSNFVISLLRNTIPNQMCIRDRLCEIAGQGVEGIAALFKGGMGMLYGGTQLETGNAEIKELISTRGMAGKMCIRDSRNPVVGE